MTLDSNELPGLCELEINFNFICNTFDSLDRKCEISILQFFAHQFFVFLLF